MAGEKILIADDEPDILTILKCNLESEGYKVVTSNDGNEALNKVKSEKPDLVLLDVMMPKINGWEVCKKIKSDAQTSCIPVIILTAKAQSVDELMSFECGADEYIPKPFDFPNILENIKKLLKK
jgi:two-component system alkaline phosphatase synthesis response regulator PhoP